MPAYSWTLPTPASQARAGVAEEQKELLLGKDILFDGDFHVTASGDYVTVSGLEALRQAIYRRLITRPGEFRLRPTYGVGVPNYVKRRMIDTEIDSLKSAIIDQLSLDDRIDEVVEVKIERESGALKIGVAVRASGETFKFLPFDFTAENLVGTV